jgi:hypothetical protein
VCSKLVGFGQELKDGTALFAHGEGRRGADRQVLRVDVDGHRRIDSMDVHGGQEAEPGLVSGLWSERKIRSIARRRRRGLDVLETSRQSAARRLKMPRRRDAPPSTLEIPRTLEVRVSWTGWGAVGDRAVVVVASKRSRRAGVQRAPVS